jgi:catechol 2,3-dioxygenase-like lactoylglutathione lyase family enzyme
MVCSKILGIKAFVPAKDLNVSKRFYTELGFYEVWSDEGSCELEQDGFGFILQKFFVKEHAGNFMMTILVEDADTWWQHIENLRLKDKYGLTMAKPPALQPWGLRVLYLTDPTGVLWHIADRPKSRQQGQTA